MPQYYNMEKANQQIYNQNLLANYHSNYQASCLANYYHLNEMDNNLAEIEKINDNKDTSISKTEPEEENEAPPVTSTNPRSKNNNKKSTTNNNYSNSSYLMQPPDSESIAVAAANASANRSKRRTRTKFDKEQLDTLEHAFERAHYPDVNQIICLSEMLNIGTERISVWFQNRRARFKKMKKETTPTYSSHSTQMIEKQIKSILNNEDDDEDEDDDKQTPLKNNNHITSSAKKTLIENIKSINEIENQLSFNSVANLGLIPKPPIYTNGYNQQHHNFNSYQISNLTSQDKIKNTLPIIKSSNENSNIGTSNNESSSSLTSTPSRSGSNTPESEEKSDFLLKQIPSNIYNTYTNYPQFSLPHHGMLPYPPAPPAISLTTPNGSVTNQLARQYQTPSLPGIGQIFQPFIDRSCQEESPYYGLNLNNNNNNINNSNNNNNNDNDEERNSTSPVSNSTRSRSASSSSSSENDNKENINENHEYDNQTEKLYANHYSQILASSIQPQAASSAHFFNHLQQQQLVNQSSYNMNAFKQPYASLPNIAHIFQPYAAACGNNNQESISYY
jgi:hypothetical protein